MVMHLFGRTLLQSDDNSRNVYGWTTFHVNREQTLYLRCTDVGRTFTLDSWLH